MWGSEREGQACVHAGPLLLSERDGVWEGGSVVGVWEVGWERRRHGVWERERWGEGGVECGRGRGEVWEREGWGVGEGGVREGWGVGEGGVVCGEREGWGVGEGGVRCGRGRGGVWERVG